MIDQLLDELKTKFNVIDICYLSNFFKPNGDQWLHDSLKLLYKPSYENLDRIVFVQDCADVIEFDGYPGKAISRLQQILSKIDISNYFVIIVSGNKHLAGDLRTVRELYSTDEVDIQLVYAKELDYSARSISGEDTFCVLPWKHLSFGPNGKVYPCCVADISLPIGDTSTQTVDEIVNSPRLIQLRTNMLHGKRSKECADCYEKEKTQSSSLRLYSNAQLVKPDEQYHEGPENFSMEWIELSIDNTCNLKCRMCSGYYSSAIASEDQKLYGTIPVTVSTKQKASVTSQLFPYLHKVTTIEFGGGEPLLSKEHYTILDQLVKCGNTDLELHYTTNFTTLNYKKNNIFDYWKQFTKIKVQASLDAHGTVAEYVRSGTVWNEVEENLHLLKTHCPHVDFWVASCVGFLNVKSLIELQHSWHTQNLLPITKFKMSIILSPEHLTVRVLPDHHKALLEQLIIPHIEWCLKHDATILADQWQNLLTYMWEENHQHWLEEFKRITVAQDRVRNQSFIKTFPEYQDLL